MKVPARFSALVLARDRVTVEGLVDELGLSEVTVRNYLSRMLREGALVRTGRGRYKVSRDAPATPALPRDLARTLSMVSGAFPDLEPVAWSISMVAQYMHDVPGRDLLAIDVKRGAVWPVGEYLAGRDVLVIRDPDEGLLDSLAWSNLRPVLLFGMGERSASSSMDGYRVATVERIWVDLYQLCTRRGLPFPLHELGTILVNAVRSGAVSVDTLLKYSSRRGLRTEALLILHGLWPGLDELSAMLPFGRKADAWVEEVVAGGREA
jgi:hypothetical protein